VRRIVALVLALAAMLPLPASAWGPIGHRIVSETAALLLERELPDTWGPVLARHRFHLGTYALLPDSHFRYDDGAAGKSEGPTHFLELDRAIPEAADAPALMAKAVRTFPRDWKTASQRLGPDGAYGTAPWRADQFLTLSRKLLKDVKRVGGSYQRGETSDGDTQKIYQALYFLGVASHYTGDATMPHHATSRWNGFENGQGGVHFYVENDCVNALEPGLSTTVLASARRKGPAWLKGWNARGESATGLMLNVLGESYGAIGPLEAIDRAHAVTRLAAAGSRDFAARKPAARACGAFRQVLVEKLAKAAVLTAWLWKSVLPGEADFSQAATLQFADFDITPKFLPTDYGR
jgi:hypothetical protein